jgi:hypothetical protein
MIKFKVIKASDGQEQRILFGWGSVAVDPDGQLVTDLHGDVIEPADLEKAVYDYVSSQRGIGYEHSIFRGIGELVECMYLDETKASHMGLSFNGSPQAAMWLGIRVTNDDIWKAVKSGELTSFSIGGRYYPDEEED